MFLDGLEDAYEEGRAMGSFAQCTADEYQLTREQMDDYAIESLRRAKDAIDNGGFKDEIVPVTIKPRGRDPGRHRRSAGPRPPRQDPAAEARLRQGRHDHRGDLIVDLATAPRRSC